MRALSDDGLFVFLAKDAQAENASLKARLVQQKYKTNSSLTAAIIRTGTGHGFVVQGADSRPYVITAGNCLPFLPVPRINFEPDERNYRSLVGPRDQDWRVSANFLVINAIANIAVIGAPDGVEYEEERRRFRLLTAAATAMSIAARREEEEGWGGYHHSMADGSVAMSAR